MGWMWSVIMEAVKSVSGLSGVSRAFVLEFEFAEAAHVSGTGAS